MCCHPLVEEQSLARGSAESCPRHSHHLCPLFLAELGCRDGNLGVPAEPPTRAWGGGTGPAPREGRARVWHGTVGTTAPIRGRPSPPGLSPWLVMGGPLPGGVQGPVPVPTEQRGHCNVLRAWSRARPHAGAGGRRTRTWWQPGSGGSGTGAGDPEDTGQGHGAGRNELELGGVPHPILGGARDIREGLGAAPILPWRVLGTQSHQQGLEVPLQGGSRNTRIWGWGLPPSCPGGLQGHK